MARPSMAVLFLVAAAVFLLAFGLPPHGALHAQSQSNGNNLVGLWHFTVPVPGGAITGFLNAHAGGTVSLVRIVDEGTLLFPGPQPGRRTTSHYQGIWHRAGDGFEGLGFLIAYDYYTGDPVWLNRLRFGINLDGPGFDTATAVYSFSLWDCPGGACPDPTDPTVPQPPEIGAGPDGEPSLPWTLSRIRME